MQEKGPRLRESGRGLSGLALALDVGEQPLQVLDVELLLLQVLPEDGDALPMLGEVGADILFPGGRQGALGKARAPNALEVSEHAHRAPPVPPRLITRGRGRGRGRVPGRDPLRARETHSRLSAAPTRVPTANLTDRRAHL